MIDRVSSRRFLFPCSLPSRASEDFIRSRSRYSSSTLFLLVLGLTLSQGFGLASANQVPGAAESSQEEPAGAEESFFTKTASWNWPDLRLWSEQWKSFLDLTQANESLRETVNASWGRLQRDDRGPHVLDQLIATASLVDRRIEKLQSVMESNRSAPQVFQPIDIGWFDSNTPGWLQENLKFAVARSYAQNAYYDEALLLMESLSPNAVIDPSSLFFYRAVCFHHLSNKEKCLEQVELLLEREAELVSRYSITAHLMRSDIQSLKPDSLDEVARLMNDVERRLELGRAGTKVRAKEKDIVDKLDKLIDQIEQELQRQQEQQKGAKSKGNEKNGQSKPMDESRIAGGSGPGDVDMKKIDKKGGWGDLPPAQRQESLQNITRDLPSHYREVIEAYFKKLGTGDQ